MINKIFSFFNFSNSVISSTPYILNIIKSNTVERKTTLGFSSFIDSSTSRERLRFSSAEDFIIYEDTSVISAWNEFLNGMIFISNIKWYSCKLDWFSNIFYHFLSSQIVVISCKINNTIGAVSEHSMVISGWGQIYRMIQSYLHWNALRPLSTQSSLIIASESIGFTISCQNYRMQTSTCNFIYIFLKQRIHINILILISLFLGLLVFVVI